MEDGNVEFIESKNPVRFLKTNSGKKGQGMPVVRNSKFYFREGLCWSDINTTFLKCRKKQNSIHDVKSMSIFAVSSKVPEDYIIAIINSTFISQYVDNFINNTQTFQINDARQLPIIVPSEHDIRLSEQLVQNAISLKQTKHEKISLSALQQKVDNLIEEIYLNFKQRGILLD